MVIEQFNVYLIDLDPTTGSEMKKTRPCVIISPNELNRKLSTVIVAPLTSVIRHYPCRLICKFQKISGEIVLDQMRALDKTRLIKRLGSLDEYGDEILKVINQIFDKGH
ncbi:MAG TPA: type II toxin-antitoxin system PemK/MazF family toxin [Sphingobacteriaceae bacterium]